MKEQMEPGVSVLDDLIGQLGNASGGALRITFDDRGNVADCAKAVEGPHDHKTLTTDQEAQLRSYLQSSSAFFALLDIWVRARERGEAQTPKELAMLSFASRVLCTQHQDVAPLLQKLVN
jgi:hypothetical protein